MLKKWLSSNIGVTAVAAVILNTFGFLTTRHYMESLGIPGKFLPESPTEYLLWGAKAIVPIFGNIVVTLLILAGVILIGAVCNNVIRLLARLAFRTILHLLPKAPGQTFTRFCEHINAGIATTSMMAATFLSSRWRRIKPEAIAGMFFSISLAILIIVSEYSDVFSNIGLSKDSIVHNYAVKHWTEYSYILTVTSGLLVCGVYLIVLRSRQSENFSRIAKLYVAGSIGATLLLVGLLILPYRLTIHAKGEKIKYGREAAAIMSETKDEFLIYMPDKQSCVIVSRADARIARDTIRSYVYFYEVQ
jgi:hypothetical protein